MIRFRQFIRYTFYSACLAVVCIAVLSVWTIILDPFLGFDASLKFVDLPGRTAEQKMNNWPSSIDPSKVNIVSFQSAQSIDSYSTWYKIQTDRETAQLWSDDIHARLKSWSLSSISPGDRGLEGVRRSIKGTPALHSTTGETPSWWNPPAINYSATEAMKWYSGFDSGVGYAAYSGYDELSKTLWVYEYSCQHDRLWEPKHMPDGDIFSQLKE